MATNKKQPLTLCVTSGKGGVGKTSFTVNFALALSRNDSRVLVIDGDMGLANVDVLLRLSVKTNVRDILESGADPRQALIFARPNLAVLPGSSGVPEMVSLGTQQQERLAGFIRQVAADFDYVIIDTAAGIGESVLWYNQFADHNIFILSPDPTSMTDAYALIKLLCRDYGINHFNLVLNFVRGLREGNHTVDTINRVTQRFLKLKLAHLGNIPEDKAVRRAVLDQVPFVEQTPGSKATRAIHDLAQRVHSLI
ncbi:MinD/ParA family protein [Desulfosarcina ovata]|uniref:Site-determining protein n=2 Tax=Desulfosarcina ovata TaxID=83564 RepID=A0A5K8ADY2_9BACT|nr:MinD/ParA family protein [Desulfosarcina ovata]BBO84321.1 site-determining protein [Desulfosarcina ovata subsp. sediminis]BBO90832.1 site-determining protein [Desulfosarcina ovata subsp. ovata]